MDLSQGHIKFDGLFKATDGRQFYGIVHVNNVLRTQNDIADYLLQVTERCFIKAGDAMFYQGLKFMLGRGVDEFNRESVLRMLRMIEVNAELPWSRAVDLKDPLTDLTISTDPAQNLGTALVNILATHQISDTFKTGNSKLAMVSNSPLQPNDKVGPYQITYSEVRHGLTYAEAM